MGKKENFRTVFAGVEGRREYVSFEIGFGIMLKAFFRFASSVRKH